MNDRLPYEEQMARQWNDLPLPDENMAWADMKKRLEKDEDSGIIPVWLRGCGLWSLFALLLLAGGWWLFQALNRTSDKTLTPHAPEAENKPVIKKDDSTLLPGRNEKDTVSSRHPVLTKEPVTNSHPDITGTVDHKKPAGRNFIKKDPVAKEKRSLQPVTRKNDERTRVTRSTTQPVIDEKISIMEEPGQAQRDVSKTKSDSGFNSGPDNVITGETRDTLTGISHLPEKDTVLHKENATTVKRNKTDSARVKSISFSAGIAEHQLLPIAGQELTPYNAQGRKGSLSDYIPAVYFRMYKGGKWFLQSEFRYGAPQYDREILYKSKGVLDSAGTRNTITSTKLKKTFYHQLPVSFNYYLLPNWSVGTGFVWNRFKAAVSEQDIVNRTVATGIDTLVSAGLVVNSTRADSNFARSYMQALFETQFQWKRFSIGARYTFGLQPYLNFTLPGGVQQREKSRSMQIFIRYELWRSKKYFR